MRCITAAVKRSLHDSCMQLSGMSDKFYLWTRNFYAYLLENGSLWGWHKPWIGGWKLRPQRIWSRKCKENHRDCFNMHSIITSFKATNVRNSCFAQKLGFTGAQHAANQTILCWICWKGPWGQVHFYFFLRGVCSMTDWFIKCEEQLRLQVLKTSSK